VRSTVIKPEPSVNRYLAEKNTPPIREGVFLDRLLKRAELDYAAVERLAARVPPVEAEVARQVEIEIKYEGYIQRQREEVDKFKHLEKIRIPEGFQFFKVHGLSNELKEKLAKILPRSLGQASRIDGMTPAALSVLMIALKSYPGLRGEG